LRSLASHTRAYLKVVRDKAPHAQLIFDRDQVEQLVRDGLD